MLIFWDQRLVCLATPKTGTTALAAALEARATISMQRPPVVKHTPSQRYHRFIAPYLRATSGAEFTTVALMREPVDWLASWYRFRRREDLAGGPNSTLGLSFDAFVRGWCSDPQPEFARVGSQARFLAPPGKPGVDHIFRYENMPRYVAFLEERLNCRLSLPQLNVSPPAEVTLSPESKALLRQHMAADFALYESLSG